MKTNYKENTWLDYLPLAIILAVVPFFTRLAVLEPASYILEAWKNAVITDFNSYYKSIFLLVMAGATLLLLFFKFRKANLKQDKTLNLIYIGFGIYTLLLILSTIFSPYKELALGGGPERYEGLWVNLAYMVILFYTIYVIKSEKDLKYIMLPIIILTLGTAFLGVFQYFGKDLLTQTALGQRLILPKEYLAYSESLKLSYESGKVYGTLYHYNYAGSFGAMIVPLFGTLAIFIKDKRAKLIFGVLALVSMFILFGSTSRAGLIGFVFAGLFFVLLFYKNIFSNIKVVGIIAGVLVAVIFGLNLITGGTIFERIPSLVNDALAIVSQSDDSFDYRDQVLVRDVVNNPDGSLTFVLQENKLNLKVAGNTVEFTDEQGEVVSFERTEESFVTQDPRFIGFRGDILMAEANSKEDLPYALQFYAPDGGMFPVMLKNNEIYLADIYTQEKVTIDFPETLGFNGKEKLGSSRGYIWSRSLPLLKDNVFLGDGPDTYIMEFPQKDLIGKYYAYGTPNVVADKPHNLYLQIAFNGGIVSLLAFLVAMGGYIFQSCRLYIGKKEKSNLMIYGSAMTLAVIGYLGAGLFNDSIVSVAPVFWIILGTGIGINYIIKKSDS